MKDAWTEITHVFEPGEYVQEALRGIDELRVYSVDDEAAIVFLARDNAAIEHAAVQVENGWTCSCPQPEPCIAVAFLVLREHAQHRERTRHGVY